MQDRRWGRWSIRHAVFHSDDPVDHNPGLSSATREEDPERRAARALRLREGLRTDVRFAAALLLLCVFAGSAAAGGGGGAKKEVEREKGSGFMGPRVPTLSMPVLIAPVIANGELHHYVFLRVTLELSGDEHKVMMLQKIPYLQDAFLREVHRATVSRENDPASVDEEGLKARLIKVSDATVGAGIVKAVQLVTGERTGR